MPVCQEAKLFDQLQTARAYGLNFLVPPFDDGVGKCLRENGEFARVELEFILAACDGDLLDVGANIGSICLPFAARRPQARVVAVEAHPEIAEVLAHNVRANSLFNVEVIHAAAGERAGLVDIPVPSILRQGNIGAGSLYDKGYSSARVAMRPIDDIAPDNCRMVKIDVEGFEPRVLDGAKRLLNDSRPSWLVEVSRHRPKTAAIVRETLSAAGYTLFWFFSPFIAPRQGISGDSRGDFAYFATDQSPPWPMSVVADDWPTSELSLPYLANRLPKT